MFKAWLTPSSKHSKLLTTNMIQETIKPNEIKNPAKEFLFKIGADPEFNILFQSDRLNANFVIKTLFAKKKLEEKELGFLVPRAGELGWDSVESTGELRPLPSNQPKEIIKHIGKILSVFAQEIKLFNLSTLSNKASVGGHIHFELPKDKFTDFAIDSNLKPTQNMKRLHRFICLFYLPLMMGENNENIKIRQYNSYGKLEDFRLQKVSGSNINVTYEFRAPSAEWLTTPKIAQATLSYLGVIFHEFLNRPESAKIIKELLLTSNDQLDTIQKMTMSNFAVLNNYIVAKIKKAVRQFELYPVFAEEIEYILNAPRVLKDKEKAKYDILHGWNMKESKMPTKRALMSDRKIKNIMLDKNLEGIIDMINIKFNPDTNCETFARSLKEKVVTLNWQLKNNYHIFGLRSGINDYIAFNPEKELYLGREQIETKCDWAELFKLLERIQQKFGFFNSKIIDTPGPNNIIVGIPYRERVKLNIKGFTEKIIMLEKGLLPKEIDSETLIEDRNKEINARGKIFKAIAQHDINDKAEMIDAGEDLATRYQREHAESMSSSTSETREEISRKETSQIIINKIQKLCAE